MATIKEKLRLEAEKPQNVIILHKEGVFYIAYEQSAWLFSLAVHSFKVKKQFVKCVAQEVVSVGFPVASLDNFAVEAQVAKEDNIAKIFLPPEALCCTPSFEQWKAGQQLCGQTGDDVVAVETPASLANNASVVLQRIKDFPVESKSPIDCMLFLSEIKSLL